MLHIRDCHPLWLAFPDHSIHTHGSAGPRSLAATRGVSIDFLSSGYLDVSVPRVCFYNPMYSGHKYLFQLVIKTKGNYNKLSGGLPHSEIHGSKPIIGSPWLIADYHVLHRLLLPRHPTNALFALDLIQKKQGLLRFLLLHPRRDQMDQKSFYFPTPAGSQGYIWVSVLDLDNTIRFSQQTNNRFWRNLKPLASPRRDRHRLRMSHTRNTQTVSLLYLSLRCQNSSDWTAKQRCCLTVKSCDGGSRRT